MHGALFRPVGSSAGEGKGGSHLEVFLVLWIAALFSFGVILCCVRGLKAWFQSCCKSLRLRIYSVFSFSFCLGFSVSVSADSEAEAEKTGTHSSDKGSCLCPPGEGTQRGGTLISFLLSLAYLSLSLFPRFLPFMSLAFLCLFR